MRRALILLSQGHLAPFVADEVGVAAETVRDWAKRNATELENLRRLHDQRVEEASALESAAVASSVGKARTLLAEKALRAAQVLTEHLDDEDPAVQSQAARTILDRVGVPRTERVETTGGEVDYSHMTPEKRALLRELLAEAMGGGSPAE